MSYAEAKSRREKIEAKLARAREREREARVAERDAAKPVEPLPNSQPVVVTFTKTYGRGRQYSYAAIRPGAGHKWFLTGRVQEGKTWDQLMEFAANKESSAQMRWEQVRMWYPLEGSLPTRADVQRESEMAVGIEAIDIKATEQARLAQRYSGIPAHEYGGYV